MFDSERNKQHQRVFCNEIRNLPNETIKQLAVKIEVRKAFSAITNGYKHKIDRTFDDDPNTTIKQNCNKKEIITSITDPRTRYRFSKTSR